MEPEKRNEEWYPTGANAADIAEKVGKPDDLIRGRREQRQKARGGGRSGNRDWNDTTKE